MAVRYAVATGNWSSTSTWNGGTLPTSADDVYANGFTVTIDQNVTVLSIRNEATTGVNIGGTFNVTSGGFTINADIKSGGNTINQPCCTLSHNTGNTTINGNISGNTTSSQSTIHALIVNIGTSASVSIVGTIRGGSPGFNNWGVSLSQYGTCTIVGDIYGGSGQTHHGLTVAYPGTVNITGNIYGGATNTANGMSVTSAFTSGTITLTGNVDARAAGANTATVNYSSNGGILNVNGNVYGSNVAGSSRGINLGSSGTVNINGNSIGGSIGIGAINTSVSGTLTVTNAAVTTNEVGVNGANSTNTTVVTNAIFSSNGLTPISGYIKFSNTNNNTVQITKQNSTTLTLTDAAAYPTQVPIPADVRKGTSYLLGSKIGTLEVPNPASVGLGVPTDNTVGTAALTPEAVWDHLVANIGTANSIGERLKNVSTVQTTAAQLAGFN